MQQCYSSCSMYCKYKAIVRHSEHFFHFFFFYKSLPTEWIDGLIQGKFVKVWILPPIYQQRCTADKKVHRVECISKRLLDKMVVYVIYIHCIQWSCACFSEQCDFITFARRFLGRVVHFKGPLVFDVDKKRWCKQHPHASQTLNLSLSWGECCVWEVSD